jgi:FtsH-binding integral membrane protein
MSFQPNSYQGRKFVADTSTFDQGLRRHMIGVYNYMLLGLVVSGLVAFYVSHSPALLQQIYGSPVLRFAVPILPLAFVLVLSFGIARLSVFAAQLTFFAFSAVMGLSLTSILLMYTESSIAEVFFISAGMFAGTSLYGYTTKSNLTGMGSFMIMGLWGIILAGLVNMFLLHSSLMDLGISVICVIVFTGLTAYSTQQIRDNYSAAYGAESNTKLAILGALNLYLNFINLFLAMLRLMGARRN